MLVQPLSIRERADGRLYFAGFPDFDYVRQVSAVGKVSHSGTLTVLFYLFLAEYHVAPMAQDAMLPSQLCSDAGFHGRDSHVCPAFEYAHSSSHASLRHAETQQRTAIAPCSGERLDHEYGAERHLHYAWHAKDGWLPGDCLAETAAIEGKLQPTTHYLDRGEKDEDQEPRVQADCRCKGVDQALPQEQRRILGIVQRHRTLEE